jgi:hypothetical protein
MTTHTWTGRIDNTNDTTFRAWIDGIATALSTIGLVQTADSGQVNTGTVTIPGVNHTAAGYQIWRMNDTHQATCPIFFKMEYGRGATATAASIWLTVGTGSDGAGTLTGIFQARVQHSSGGGNDTNNRTNYACAQDGIFWLAHSGAIVGSAPAWLMGFSRFCDDNGTVRDDGGLFFTGHTGATNSLPSAQSAGATRFYRPTLSAVTGGSVAGIGALPVGAMPSSGAYGTDVAVWEAATWSDQPRKLFGLVVGKGADFSFGSTVSAEVFGATRTLILPWLGHGFTLSTDTSARALMVYS